MWHFLAAAAQVAQGTMQYQNAQAQAREYKRAGEQAFQAALLEEQDVRRATRRAMAQQRMDLLATGQNPGRGSAAEVGAADASEAELAALRTRYKGQVAKDEAFAAARAVRRQGTAALVGSAASAGSYYAMNAPSFGGG